MQNKIKFNKEDFKVFLNGLSKVSDSAILHLESDRMYAITASEDRAMFLYSSCESENDTTAVLNLPSLKKLAKTMDLVPESEIEFNLNTNNLEYSGKRVKFKYHLYGDGILVAPKITLSKIESLKYDHEFTVETKFILAILKNSSVFKDTNKLYVYTKDDQLVWSLGDKTMANTDVFTVIGDDVDFEMDEFIISLDNLRLLSYKGIDSLNFSINKIGIGCVTVEEGNIQQQYILSSLTK